jgi:hypothetical protein
MMRYCLLILVLIAANKMIVLGQGHPSDRGDSKMVMSTSESIDLARTVGRDQGIDVDDRRRVTLDLLVTKDGKPMLPGYITLGIYRDLELVSEVSINEKTGQLVDSESCAVYEYPDILYVQKEYAKYTGARPLTITELSSEIGCESLKELRVPAAAPTKQK